MTPSDALPLIQRVTNGYQTAFGRRPEIVAVAPGRVNLIGEHTDYNDGLVLPIAIDAWCACAAGLDPLAGGHGPSGHVIALDLGERRTLGPPARLQAQGPDTGEMPIHRGHWASYVAGVLRGVAAAALEPAAVPPLDLALGASIPMGGGLSSSAALEVSVALAACKVWGVQTGGALALARLCQRAEHEFAGVPCGLMDQCASLMARAGSGLLLDCRTLSVDLIPLPPGAAVVVVDTGVRHALASGFYAQRREECRAACQALGLRTLREASPTDSERITSPVLRARARHVVRENERVRGFAEALRLGDVSAAGRLMHESHASLRDDYAVSCPELDHAAGGLMDLPGVHGARMTGGGFGGCAIALVEAARATAVVREAAASGLGVSARVARAEGGAWTLSGRAVG